MAPYKDPIPQVGDRYHNLVVLSFTGNGYVDVLCDCGTMKNMLLKNIRAKHHPTKSCGCLNYSAKVSTHKMSYSSEYSIWKGIRRRCNNPKASEYKFYGGRGIKVCDRWNDSFENFLQDVGLRPSMSHTLDRIDPDGNYEPENVRWATMTQQQRNRRDSLTIEVDGYIVNMHDYAEKIGMNPDTLRFRIFRAGWSVQDAVTKPIKRNRPLK